MDRGQTIREGGKISAREAAPRRDLIAIPAVTKARFRQEIRAEDVRIAADRVRAAEFGVQRTSHCAQERALIHTALRKSVAEETSGPLRKPVIEFAVHAVGVVE